MLEGMQKYTVDEETNELGADRTGFSASNTGGQSGGTSLSMDQPSLLKDNLEEEDANVGRNFVVSSVSLSSSAAVKVDVTKDGEHTLLATSLPGSSSEDAVVIKHDLDGAIFTSSSAAASDWKHTATMPALAFVLASKRDAQRVHIHRRQKVDDKDAGYVALAFESAPQVTGSGGNGSSNIASGAGNLFLYYSPSNSTAKHAQSRVVRLGANAVVQGSDLKDGSSDEVGSASGALLGVCSAVIPRAKEQGEAEVLLCLCENRILLLRGVL